ncbi:MAG: sigma-70 family RNA polymerase sigma factor [Gemmatimonadaceae bacterium]|nr:sigma-70 family RNA polymerase sigma factor [Gemmatimonadaceae bacterium]
MGEQTWLAERFEADRAHLRAVAYRMLGSLSEAEDAVQEAWLRLSRSDTSGVQNLSGWLTTVVARVCLDMLRSRTSRREEPLDAHLSALLAAREPGSEADRELQLADSVGLALLVVLETLTPAERVAFVLHDVFDLSFDEIAPIVGRTPVAARQLASRARRRVKGTAALPKADLAEKRRVVDAYLAAVRGGDFEALLTVLDPDIVLRTDRMVAPAGAPAVLRGAAAVAQRVLAAPHRGRFARVALVNGVPAIIIAPRGRLALAIIPTIADGKIVALDAIAEPARLRELEVGLLED